MEIDCAVLACGMLILVVLDGNILVSVGHESSDEIVFSTV